MSDDLLKRLDNVYASEENGPLCHKAAARIRELQAENAGLWIKLRAARADALAANRDALAAELQLAKPADMIPRAEAEAMVRAERAECALIASEASAEAVDDGERGWDAASYLNAVAKAILARDGEAGK